MRRPTRFVLVMLVAVGFSWSLGSPATAIPTVSSIETATGYGSVTVTFDEDPTVNGGGAIEASDVEIDLQPADLSAITLTGPTLTLTFNTAAPVGGELSFPGLDVAATIDIPVAASDWGAIDASLRAIALPAAEIPIVPYLGRDEAGATPTIGSLLPATTASSLDLPPVVTVARNTGGTFTVTVAGTSPISTESLDAAVFVDEPYALDLVSGSPVPLELSLDGTVDLTASGAIDTIALTLRLVIDNQPATLNGAVGLVEASVPTTLDLDVAIPFDASDDETITPVITTASAGFGDVTIDGLGGGGTDLVVSNGTTLLTIDWPTLPAEVNGVRQETAVGTDSGWDGEGLLFLANVGLNDFVGGPGALASWMGAAQSLGDLETQLPAVGVSVGESIGVAERLAAVHNVVASAIAVISGPLAPPENPPVPNLSGSLCNDLRPFGFRSAQVAKATDNITAVGIAAERDFETDPITDAEILAEIPNFTLDRTATEDAFALQCQYLYSSVVLDLDPVDPNITAEVAIPATTGGVTEEVALNVGYDELNLGTLAVNFEGHSLTRSASPALDFTMGLKLDNADELVNHGLGTDLDNDPPDPTAYDANDVTAAYRIYLPYDQNDATFATSDVDVSATGLVGSAQIGFLDLGATGELSITPTVSLALAGDPGTGFADAKLDLVELIAASTLAYGEENVETDIDTVLAVDFGSGDDVDISLTFDSGVLDADPGLDIAGDLSGLLAGGTVDFLDTAVAAPDPGKADTLEIGQTFGDSLNLAEITPFEAVSLVADLLETLAANAAVGSADQRIPIVDVSFDEVAGFTTALSDAADLIRDRAPTSITELETFVNDALEANGLGEVDVAFDPAGPSGSPELTIELDAGYSAAASYPISFELDGDAGEIFNIAPVDGGANLDAEVTIGFAPLLGIRFDDTLSFSESLFVRNVELEVAASVVGTIDGGIAVGGVEAFLTGQADISGTFTAGLTRDGTDPTVSLADIAAGTFQIDVAGVVPVAASLNLEVPTPIDPITGSVTVASPNLLDGPDSIVFTTSLSFPDLKAYFAQLRPNLRTLATGVTQTSRFMATSADAVGALTGEVPVVGEDISTQFVGASDILDQVADEVETLVAQLDDAPDPKDDLEAAINDLFTDIGCTGCSVAIIYTDGEGGEEQLFADASGLEILLTIGLEVGASTSASAGFGLEPIIDLSVDLTNAQVTVGVVASIGLGVDVKQGFYLFPGIGRDDGDDVGTIFELYASANIATDLTLNLAGVEVTATGSTIDVGGSLQGGTAGGLKIEMPDQLLLADLINRDRKLSDVFQPSVDATVDASIPAALAIDLLGNPLVLTLPFEFHSGYDNGELEITLNIEDATFDASSLALLAADALTTFNKDYNPLNIPPIKKALDANVPLIEQPVREVINALCGVAVQASPTGPCAAYLLLANIDEVTTELQQIANDGGIVPLGSFQILPAPAAGVGRYTPPGETQPRPPATTEPDPEEVDEALEGTPAATILTKVQDFTRGYVTLPILSDVPAMMGIVLGGELGEDVDIIRFEIPEESPIIVGKSFAIKKTLFSLETGFIDGELKIDLSGGVGLTISGGFGYSTRGISNGNFFDGIFLIDNGLNEIGLGASVAARVDGRFGVKLGSLELASVRFRGGGSFSANGGLDLFDESPVLVGRGGGDGRLFFDEIDIIIEAYKSPIPGDTANAFSFLCMFQLRTTGAWSLSFSGKAKVLGITVFNETFDESGTLWDETISCELRTRIARVENRKLILHAGPNARDRFDGVGDVSENFDVSIDGTDAVVDWVNGVGASMTFPLSSFDSIVAEMGVGDDVLTIADGITKPVYGRGGPGLDNLTGGGGHDDLAGGLAGDTINGGSGNDRIRGDAGSDTLTGGPGNDNIGGGQNGDTIIIADGFGQDTVQDSGTTGVDTLDLGTVTTTLVGTTAFGDSTIKTAGSKVTYPAAVIEIVKGGAAGDTFAFKDQEPQGFSFDGQGAGDAVTVQSGTKDRRISITDSGTSGTDTMLVLGTSTGDEFLLRAASSAPGQIAGEGFVARLSNVGADRYDYDDSIENLTVDGRLGNDEFSVDDNATVTNLIGGFGNDVVQVGQVYGLADCDGNGAAEATCAVGSDTDSTRNGSVGVEDSGDYFATTVITRGHLSNGVTHDLQIDGGDNDDSITIFANNAPVTANGGDGDDRFVARAFIVSASVQLNGEGGIDDFSYVVNDQIDIDGGAGVDTFTIIGTEANDGFIIDTDTAGAPTVQVCPIGGDGRPDPAGSCAISASVDAVEVFAVLGLEGDDVFWIRSSVDGSLVQLSGGDNSDRFLIGDGTLDSIDGPVEAAGDALGNIPAMPDPVVLPGEDDTPSFEPTNTGGTNRGDVLEIDAGAAAVGLTGEFSASAVEGLGMADGPFVVGDGAGQLTIDDVLTFTDLEFIDAVTGSGDDVVTVSGTHLGNDTCDSEGCPLSLGTGLGNDSVDVQSISGETTVDLGGDDDSVTVGASAFLGDTLDQIDGGLIVIGGAGIDDLDLDDSNDGPTRLDIDPGLVTKAGLDADGVAHSETETITVRLGASSDVANIRGTAADATTATHVYGGSGDERFYVSSAADFELNQSTDELGGDLDDVAGPLMVHGGGGADNLLYVSDREATAGNGGVSYDGAILSGMAPAAISHDVTGAFGGGITVWTSEFVDVISIGGSDRSTVTGTRTLTTFNTGDGADVATIDLSATADGPFVLNGEEGDDTVDGTTSTLDLLVFGGLGGDNLTTGAGDDVVFGDLGTASTADGGTVTGGGGPGDTTDGGTQPIDQLTTDDSGGAADTIATGSGQDVAIGGVGGDDIDGGGDDDLLIGGHLSAGSSDVGDTIDGGPGDDLIAGDNAGFDTGSGAIVLTLLDVATTASPAPAGTGGADTIDGGGDDDRIYGQQADDDLSGGGGDDVIEGNGGADTISGGGDQDDLIGGGSALDGVLDDQRSWLVGGVALADDNDTIDGDGAADVILGDNGRIVRSGGTLAGLYGAQNPAFDDLVIRQAQVTNGIDPAGSFGADLLRGGDGPDEIHGQLDTSRTSSGGNVIAGDELLGGPGSDVLIGDLGSVTTVLEDGSRTETVANNPFLEAVIHQSGTLTREVTLFLQQDGDHVDDGDRSDATQFGAEGDDLMFGGDDSDVIHGGGGDDVANGGAGTDAVFGGDGNDALWGGPDDDTMWGGHDEDALDVLPRDFTTTTRGRDRVTLGPDPAIWFEAATSASALGGLDIAYGGWNSDELQADEKVNGPRPGDRLVDWTGAYNRYLGCTSGNGAGTFLRGASPGNRAFVSELAEGRGAVGATIPGTSGYREIGLVENEDNSNNSGSVGGTDHVNCP